MAKPRRDIDERLEHDKRMDKRDRKLQEAEMVTGRMEVLLDIMAYLNKARDTKEVVYSKGDSETTVRRNARELDPEEKKLYEGCLGQLTKLVSGEQEGSPSLVEDLKQQLAAAKEAADLGGWDKYRDLKEGCRPRSIIQPFFQTHPRTVGV